MCFRVRATVRLGWVRFGSVQSGSIRNMHTGNLSNNTNSAIAYDFLIRFD